MGAIEALVIFLVIGAIAGWLAGLIVKGGGFGLLGDIVVGVLGYAAAMAYLPSQRISIAVSVTLREDAPMGNNRSIDVLREIATYLAPQAPIGVHGMH